MSKLLRAALSAEEKIGEAVTNHKLLKSAIFMEENAAKLKKIILQKTLMGLSFLGNKLQK